MTGEDRLQGIFRALVESAPDAMVIVDMAGEIVLVNAQTEKVFGYRREELLGRGVEMLVPERFQEYHSALRTGYAAAPLTRSMGAGLELYGRRSDGTEFPVEISLSPLETEDGTLVSSAIRDVTERKRAERAASHFIAIVRSADDAIIGKDLKWTVTSWNHGAERLFGYAEAEILGRSVSVLAPPGHDDDLLDILRRVQSGEQIDEFETVGVRRDGTQVDVSMTVSPIRLPEGTIIGASTIARDITIRRRYQEQLVFLAEHDLLTGTRNRRRFERDLSEQIGRSRRYGEQAALLSIDIDGFKQINDVHGHNAGDKVLRQIGVVLKQRLREADIVARIGGDEFMVLLPYADASQAQVVSESLREVVCETRIELDDGTKLSLSVSVGTTLIDAQTASSDAVLVEADRAMYQDKARSSRSPQDPPR
jgi:diguanylate cyclase (GGDEF)-like protein/PAS domain S-box-containing protein